MIVNVCYNSTAPNIGLRLNRDRMTLKCYMADTYKEQLNVPYVLHTSGLMEKEGIVYLPLYMTPLL